MKHRGRGKGKPAAPPPTGPGSGAGAGQSAERQPARPESKGFGAAFKDLVDRKTRELGAKWRALPSRARMAEARRRAAREMARRIEKQSGHRPAESTIRRNAARDTTPRFADQQRLDRQAKIDKLGGVKKAAARMGVTSAAVSRWRDDKGPLSPAEVTVSASFDGVLYADGAPYPRALAATVATSDPEEADAIRAAWATDDYEELMVLLSLLVTQQVEWSGAAEREYVIHTISDLRLS